MMIIILIFLLIGIKDISFVKDDIGRKKIVNVNSKLVIERIVRKSVAQHLPSLLDEPCIHQD